MKVIAKGSFDRDIDKLRNRDLKNALEGKINQLLDAKDVSHVTGLKILRGYDRHCRIIVTTTKLSYRIGAILRGDTIWLVRFLPRKIIYKKFP